MSDTISEAKVGHWLKEAEPGQKLHYFQGFLASATDSVGQALPESERQVVACIANRLWRAAHRGLVHLVQRRQGPMNWTYIAIARSSSARSGCSNNSSHMEMYDVEV
jgi:hypothetical protein